MSVRPVRWASLLAVTLVVGGLGRAQESRGARSQPRLLSGDGRGMATFGDRGLTSFGDRFREGFGSRGLTSFGETPLAPMGGLVTRDARAPSARHGTARRSGGLARQETTRRTRRSIATIHGVAIAHAAFTATVVELPRVELPVVTLDHRPALSALASELEAELERVRRRGDLDLARSLSAALER